MKTKGSYIFLFIAVFLTVTSCEKTPVEPVTPEPTPVPEEHHNVLVGHKWERTGDTISYGLHIISKCVLSFFTDSTGDYYAGFEVVGVQPWDEFTENTTYTFDEENNLGIINRIPIGDYVPDIIYFEYCPENETLVLNSGVAFYKKE